MPEGLQPVADVARKCSLVEIGFWTTGRPGNLSDRQPTFRPPVKRLPHRRKQEEQIPSFRLIRSWGPTSGQTSQELDLAKMRRKNRQHRALLKSTVPIC